MNKKMPTIALVDDDRNILTSVGMALENEGYSVQKYNDGAAALQGLQDNPPDMAIFDIKMPRMDGMELLRRIRQKSDLPVIFLTSKDDEIDELFGLKMGADDFIKKPFSQRLLVERVKAVMRRAVNRDVAATPAEAAKVIASVEKAYNTLPDSSAKIGAIYKISEAGGAPARLRRIPEGHGLRRKRQHAVARAGCESRCR